MYYDYNKRSYLLPPGCKDLIDLLRLEEQKRRPSIQLPFLQAGDVSLASPQDILGPWKLKKKLPKEPQTESLNTPSNHEVVIQDEILVTELAKIAGQKPFKIIGDLMEIGIFSNMTQMIGFEAASRVLKKYGITTKKAG